MAREIRVLGAEGIRTAVDWARREGWNPGLGDAVKARALTTAGRYYALAREYVSREN